MLRQVEGKDQRLADDLRREFAQLSKRRAFGLNFERHVPESVELPGRPVRKGDKVRFLPERGQSAAGLDRRLWQVMGFRNEGGQHIAELARRDSPEAELERSARAVADLVVVAEFRDPIFPGLKSVGRVTRCGDKPFHTVINAENYHALQALLYTHEGRVDAIYIDPPYNTRDKDWKYNNDYVDSDDQYRHSKWLAMMERRLRLAGRLLNPQCSVLIVTIDEKEVHRLGCLLEQVFPNAPIQMISSVIAPQGSQRPGRFSRVEEYLYFVFIGSATATPTGDPMIITTEEDSNSDQNQSTVAWDSLLRRGTDALRENREEMFYPILISRETRQILDVGDPLGPGVTRSDSVEDPDVIVRWPIRTDGTEGRWQLGRDTFIRVLKKGMARVGRQYAVTYLKSGDRRQIKEGAIMQDGTDAYGYPVYKRRSRSVSWPRTMWNKRSHNASVYGSTLLRDFVPQRKFPFPKSLYAVEDSLRFLVLDKPDAVIMDFFSGSGTTCHAVMRLNKQDGGKRQCISITNNEVSADEQKALREQGLRPGDPDWEKLGICEYITQPRITAAITGKTPDGEPIKGDYKFTDEFPMAQGFEENVEFFKLTYEAPRPVAHHRAFQAIAPLLWLKAGAQGERIDEPTEDFAVVDRYGILFDLDRVGDFVAALEQAGSANMAFIVTDDDRGFQSVCRELPADVVPVRLYESYLKNFTINIGRE